MDYSDIVKIGQSNGDIWFCDVAHADKPLFYWQNGVTATDPSSFMAIVDRANYFDQYSYQVVEQSDYEKSISDNSLFGISSWLPWDTSVLYDKDNKVYASRLKWGETVVFSKSLEKRGSYVERKNYFHYYWYSYRFVLSLHEIR